MERRGEVASGITGCIMPRNMFLSEESFQNDARVYNAAKTESFSFAVFLWLRQRPGKPVMNLSARYGWEKHCVVV